MGKSAQKSRPHDNSDRRIRDPAVHDLDAAQVHPFLAWVHGVRHMRQQKF
jgi:hypothetical protein